MDVELITEIVGDGTFDLGVALVERGIEASLPIHDGHQFAVEEHSTHLAGDLLTIFGLKKDGAVGRPEGAVPRPSGVGGVDRGDVEHPSVPNAELDGLRLVEHLRPARVVVGHNLRLAVGYGHLTRRAGPGGVAGIDPGGDDLDLVRTSLLEGDRVIHGMAVDLEVERVRTADVDRDRDVAADDRVVVVPGEQGRVATGEQDAAEQRRDEHGTHGVLLCPEGRHLPRCRALL